MVTRLAVIPDPGENEKIKINYCRTNTHSRRAYTDGMVLPIKILAIKFS